MMKLKACSLKPVIDYYSLNGPIDLEQALTKRASVCVEIGFGMGEVLIRNASGSLGTDFIGIEQHWQRVYKTLKSIDRSRKDDPQALDNIRILYIDAWVAFERLFLPKSIDQIYCLFPCPWPKKGHIKHRLFSREFLKVLNSRLKDKGSLMIVTDFYPFFNWVKEQIDPEDFVIKESTAQTKFDTKFERKWKNEGQEKFFEIHLVKTRHIDVSLKGNVPLKSYSLKKFIPEEFLFEDITGKVAVVLKDKLYDHSQKRLLLRLIVNEEHLTQNFWITIFASKDGWRLCSAEGQNFFPTPGVNLALDAVYQAALKQDG